MKYWISCNKFTVRVEEQNGRIVKAAPIVSKFINQPLSNLIQWAGKLGDLKIEKLHHHYSDASQNDTQT